MKVVILYEKQEIVFSCCSDSNGGIQAAFFNKALKTPDFSFIQFSSCENIYGHSILYSNNEQDYFVVSDVKCNGIEYIYQKLTSTPQ